MSARIQAMTIVCGLIIVGGALLLMHPVAFAGQQAADQGFPSYHAYAPHAPYPATLDPKQFPDALNRNVYAMAAKIKPVLYQQPCYCFCDRALGHKSLLDCFADTHGSQCDLCEKEAVFAYQQTQKGRTPPQIRAAIIHGDWKSVDLRPYSTSSVHH